LFALDVAGVSVSTGSACQAGVPEPSHVLRAMGRSESESRGALRITLGHTSTEADVDALLAALPAAHALALAAGMADRVPGR
jgi:cysteine desulfurase